LDAVEVKFKDFVLRWVPAIRTSARGRASGGNCNHWERDSGKLYEVLNHARLNESALIIGDCDARLGEAQLNGFDQQLVTSSLNKARNAKDKVTDANGRHLMDLVELFGFTVVNGRSASDRLITLL